MEIKRFKDKSVVVYSGYAADEWMYVIDRNRIKVLRHLGFNKVIYDAIDYDGEWEKDECRSMFYKQLAKVKDVDLIIGHSLGGYTAYEIAGHLPNAKLIMINPSIDRNKTRLDIKWYDVEHKRNFGGIELFLGADDILIDKRITLEYLKRNNINFKYHIIPEMDHGTPIEFFIKILKMSKFI